MYFSRLLLLASGAAAGLIGQSSNVEASPFGAMRKRDLLSCSDTYGQGSVNCGGAGSTFCYNPSLGQSCCPTDFGYCQQGSYCAPVAGFCCLEGESLEACAQAAGFQIPATVVQTISATLTLATASVGVGVGASVGVSAGVSAADSAADAQTTPSPIIITLGTTTSASVALTATGALETETDTATSIVVAWPTGGNASATFQPTFVTAGATSVDRSMLWISAVVGALVAVAAL